MDKAINNMGGSFSHLTLEDLYYYDETSPSCLRHAFTKSPKAPVDGVAGSKAQGGWQVRLPSGRLTPARRVVWRIANGSEPDEGLVVHHINGDKFDNRTDNLEAVDRWYVNTLKKNSETTGIYKTPYNTYTAFTSVNHKTLYLGSFKTVENAKIARAVSHRMRKLRRVKCRTIDTSKS